MLEPEKVSLALLPTPLHPLHTLSAELGQELWIKRDDLTGFAGGGNKARKLEYLMADALKQNAEVIVTCGALQSNFIRQLGAACAKFEIRCRAVVMPMPYEAPALPAEPALRSEGGNVFLDELFGVELVHHPNGTWEQMFEAMAHEVESVRISGANVYPIALGGSSPLGIYAFWKAAHELTESFDWIVFASSSGSTHLGLAYAFADSGTRVLGICSDPEPEIATDFALSGAAFAERFGHTPLLAHELELSFDYVGEGYNARLESAQGAIAKMARKEGILLDPIYSGKAFAGLLDLIQRGKISGKILFWHTGGTPSLFAQV